METYQRQLVLLIGFMSLLAAVVLFLFVYAPEPLDVPSVSVALPEPVYEGLNASLEGWRSLMSDVGTGVNATTS